MINQKVSRHKINGKKRDCIDLNRLMYVHYPEHSPDAYIQMTYDTFYYHALTGVKTLEEIASYEKIIKGNEVLNYE
jgi:hypothetical protein